MSSVSISFFQMMKLVKKDKMMIAAGTAPILAGLAIKFLVPFGENLLIQNFGCQILTPYYGLFDILYASLSPAMFCFIAAMVMLEEHDDHIDRALFVTGLGRKGYFISRIIIPALLALAVTVVLFPVFSISKLSILFMALLAISGTVQGIIVAQLVVGISSNKLEGMAVTKVSSIIILGALVPYFIPMPLGYVFSFLPSFWMGMGIEFSNPVYLAISCVIGGILAALLQIKVNKKI